MIGGIIEILGSAHCGSGFTVRVCIYAAFRCCVGISFINFGYSFKARYQARFEDALPGTVIFPDHHPVDQ